MALVVHYPLNHDNKNYGISSVPYDDTETTFIKGGKIGKCYYQKKTVQQNRYYIEELDGIRTFSIGMWINFDQNPDWSRAISLGTAKDGVTHPSVLRFESSYTAQETSSQFGIYNSPYYTIMQPNLGACGKKTRYGEWHHFIFTTDGSTCRFYKDGVEIGNSENIGGHLTGYIYFGNADTTGTNCNCKLNDIRIYDHCLSDSEIKEVYKTPILKYSFDYPLTDPTISTASDPNMTWGVVTNNCENMGKIIYDKEYVIDDQCFTISFDIEIKDIVGVDGAKAAMRIQDNTILNGETSSQWTTIINTNEIYGRLNKFASNDGTREIDLRKNGIYHICRTYKITNTSRFKQNWNIQIRTDNITGGVAKVSNFRVVLGKKEIPYNGTDGIIYDESGMGNDGVLTADDKFSVTSYSTDSKIGEGCYMSKTKDVDNASCYGYIKTDKIFNEVPEISIAFWLYVPKQDKSTGDNTILGCSGGSNNWDIWIYRQGTTLVANMYHIAQLREAILEREKWQHISITAQKNGSMKMYVNGKLIKTKDNIVGLDWADAYLTIGDLRAGRGLSFDGRMDDLRIYATELNDDEIYKLYKERARVDSKGNLYCNELVEVPYKIDFIRSDGNQYIDTEIIPDQDSTSNIKIEMKVGNVEVPDHYAAFYGSISNNLFQFWSYVDRDIQNKINVRYSGRGFQTGTVDLEKPLVIAQEQNGFYINGDKVVTHSGCFHNSYNIYLFNVNNNGAPQSEGYGIRMDLYYCKMWKNDEIVRDFIPAISNEVGHMNEVCLYDLVTNRYFYNLSGAGEFVMNEPHLDMLATDEVKINEKGIVNCAILNEGKSIAKIIHKNSIFETNQINEN